MVISASSSLNRQIVWLTTLVAFVALFMMFFGFMAYGYIFDLLFPGAGYSTEWTQLDFVVLGVIVAVGQVVAAIVGVRAAKRLVKPLVTVTEAARSIAAGDFAGRATGVGSFGEGDRLIEDFNQMAEQLQRAEQELKYSNSAIAHELRTPLTILRGRMQGLADGVYQPSQDMFLGLIKHIDSLTRIVEDLRTLSLMNAGRMELHLSKFDLSEEVADIVSSMKPFLITLQMEPNTYLETIVVLADRARIRQATLAILDNVGRYAPGSKLEVRTFLREGNAVLTIADDGPGLNGEKPEKAFERFWRADDARTRTQGGSGLGLSVVKAIAEAHGGFASIQGGEPAGTLVTISIPLDVGTAGH